jgi:hypothetical protein
MGLGSWTRSYEPNPTLNRLKLEPLNLAQQGLHGSSTCCLGLVCYWVYLGPMERKIKTCFIRYNSQLITFYIFRIFIQIQQEINKLEFGKI